MTPKSVEVFTPQHQKCSLLSPTAAPQGASATQFGRDGSCRYFTANTTSRKPSRIGALAFFLLAFFLFAGAGALAQNGVFTVAQAVGMASVAQPVTVTAQVAGTVSTVDVLTMGAPGLDFAGVAASSTCPAATLAVSPAPTTCTESVTFTPTAPGVRMGAVVLLDNSTPAKVLGVQYLSGIGSGGLGVLTSGNILVVAGEVGLNKNPVTDGVPATQTELSLPSGVAVDGAGNLYIADTAHNLIRKVATPIPPATVGIISTYAGTGLPGYGGDHGQASSATLDQPTSVALDGAGNLYIADTNNNAVRMVAAANGVITTVAGTGVAGYVAGQDGGPATLAELSAPLGVTIDADGDLYIADTGNQRIRRVDAVLGVITTVAGNGTAGFAGDGSSATAPLTELNGPSAVAFDSKGNMYIADSQNSCIREVSGGIISLFAGNGTAGYQLTDDGGPAVAAELNIPSGLAVDAAGNVYIADTQNDAIRRVSSAASAAPGIITTVARTGIGEFFSNNVFAPVLIYEPIGLFLDSSDNLYFADSLDMVIREMQSNFVALDFTKTPIRQGSESAAQDQNVENDGNAPLTLTAPDIFVDTNDPLGVNAALAPNPPTTCPESNPFLAANTNCVIGAIFAPSLQLTFAAGVASEPLDANIYIGKTGDTVNSPLDIELVGTALALNTTTLTLTSSLNPSNFPQNVIFAATVTTGAGTGALTGTVTFYDNNGLTVLQANVPLVGNVASYATTMLTVGQHAIVATYNGDPSHFSSTGALIPVQTVNEFTATTLTSNLNPSPVGQSVTFTAIVTTPDGGGVPLDGSVTFTNNGAPICTAIPLVFTAATGTYAATCTPATTALAQGPNTIEAIYSGDLPKFILGSNATISQDMQAASAETLISAPNPSVYGTPVVFTIVVPNIGSVAATGSVNILETGQATPLGAVVLAGNPGTATFTTFTLAVGTDVITAAYQGDAYYSPSNATVKQVVTQATTSTTVTAVPNPGIAGAPVAITATVKVTQGVVTPTGTVTFADTFNGVTVALGGITPLTTAGTATINVTLAPGLHSIVATYSGDTNTAGSVSAPFALTVAQAATQTTLTVTPNPAIVDTTVTLTAVVASVGGGVPTGSVVFTDTFNGITVTLNAGGTALNGTGTATFTTATLAVGTHSITATYGGDTDDAASTSSATSLVVNMIPTVTNLGVSTTTGGNPQVILVAVVLNNATGSPATLPVPTGTVTFTSGTTLLGTATLDSTGVATLTPNLVAGTLYTVIAAYSGDALHSPSSSTSVSVSATATGFTLAVTPPSVTVATTQNVSVNVALTSIQGFTDTIGLGCASLPAGVNCHFAVPSVNLPANGVENVTLIIDTNNPLGGGSTAMNRRAGGRSISLAGLFLPLGVLFGCIFWRFRRRYGTAMNLVLVLLLGTAALLLSGCSGSFSQSSATPGTYVIQVTGTGANSDLSRYQNVTLVITAK